MSRTREREVGLHDLRPERARHAAASQRVTRRPVASRPGYLGLLSAGLSASSALLAPPSVVLRARPRVPLPRLGFAALRGAALLRQRLGRWYLDRAGQRAQMPWRGSRWPQRQWLPAALDSHSALRFDPVRPQVAVFADEFEVGQHLRAEALVRQMVELAARDTASAALWTVALAVASAQVPPVVGGEVLGVALKPERSQNPRDGGRTRPVGPLPPH